MSNQYLVGVIALSVAVGFAVGVWYVRRTARLPVCMCTHHLGAHHPETGECETAVERKASQDDSGRFRTEWVDCACLRYTGPGLPARWVVVGGPAAPPVGSGEGP